MVGEALFGHLLFLLCHFLFVFPCRPAYLACAAEWKAGSSFTVGGTEALKGKFRPWGAAGELGRSCRRITSVFRVTCFPVWATCVHWTL